MKNKGITLIALVITIIILLILAGITINSLTNSGLLTKAEEATKISKLKEIEEFARLSYMERQLEEITEGKGATIAGVINDLKEKGYIIKDVTGTGNKVSGIKLSSDEIVIGKNSTETLIYTIVYEQKGDVKYFTEVEGKDYEIIFNNGEITVNTKETNLADISNKPKLTIETSNSNILEAKVIEEGKIELTSKELVGNVEITIKEENSNVTKTLKAIVKVMPEKLTLSSTEETIKRMSKIKLNATVEPSDVTDELIWSVENSDVVNVENDGTVTGKGAGTSKVFVMCGDLTTECIITVTNEEVLLSSLGESGLSLSDLFIFVEKSSDHAYFNVVNEKLDSIGFVHGWSTVINGWCEMKVIWDLNRFKEKYASSGQICGKIMHRTDSWTHWIVSYKSYGISGEMLQDKTVLERNNLSQNVSNDSNPYYSDFSVTNNISELSRLELRMFMQTSTRSTSENYKSPIQIFLENLRLR